MTSKRTVEFDVQKKVKQPTGVEFKTRDGKKVDFLANKTTRIPVHIKFKAKP